MKPLPVLLMALISSIEAHAAPLTSAQRTAIDAAATKVLANTQVPSASIAVVVDGEIAYCRAYGDQRLDGSPPGEAGKQFRAG